MPPKKTTAAATTKAKASPAPKKTIAKVKTLAAVNPATKASMPSGKTAAVRFVDDRCPLPASAAVLGEYDCMLNQTDISNNSNKFYKIQALSADGQFYCWNRWGRVGEPGQSALRGPFDRAGAVKEFEKKFKDKTSNSWRSRNKFVEQPGKYTLIKIKATNDSAGAGGGAGGGGGAGADGAGNGASASTANEGSDMADVCSLTPQVQNLLSLIYTEACLTVTSCMDASITDEGIETPLGVLDEAQVVAGQSALEEAFRAYKDNSRASLGELSSRYYTLVPHRFGRQVPPVLNSDLLFESEFQLMELLRDMVAMGTKSKGCLNRADPTARYKGLGCTINYVATNTSEFKKVRQQVKDSQLASHGTEIVSIKNVFRVSREDEEARYSGDVIGGEKALYHGSRISNWVGLLSRGILLPKAVVQLGVKRTDAGWLGHGIYFGNADTAAGYAGVSKKSGTGFMLQNVVALGKSKEYEKITYGLTQAPAGYDSTRGVQGSEFYDDEYVVYDDRQQKMQYLIEFTK